MSRTCRDLYIVLIGHLFGYLEVVGGEYEEYFSVEEKIWMLARGLICMYTEYMCNCAFEIKKKKKSNTHTVGNTSIVQTPR